MGHRPPQPQAGPAKPAQPDLRKIIQGTDVDSTRELVKAAEAWGKYLAAQKLTTSQIRTIFGLVRLIELSWPSDVDDPERARKAERDLILLKPKLAYQARRNKPVEQLAQLLSPAIDLVQGNRDNFQRFVDFFEAILAYHKAEGGK